jgi:hypothetical protein
MQLAELSLKKSDTSSVLLDCPFIQPEPVCVGRQDHSKSRFGWIQQQKPIWLTVDMRMIQAMSWIASSSTLLPYSADTEVNQALQMLHDRKESLACRYDLNGMLIRRRSRSRCPIGALLWSSIETLQGGSLTAFEQRSQSMVVPILPS